MDKLVGKAKEALGNKENNFGQPGDSIESSADNTVNNEVNQIADNAGMPSSDNSMLDKFVDKEVNSEIPGGN